MFQSVILAGGFGTRLKSVSGSTPKPMVEVNGEPFLYKIMRQLESQGCEKIVLSLHYMAEAIMSYISADQPVSCEIVYSVEAHPLGTGGALKASARHITSERFIALNGDTFCDLKYLNLLVKSDLSDLLIAAVRVDEVSRYGQLVIDSKGNVTNIREKKSHGSGLINAGTYVLKKSEILAFPCDTFSFENEFLPAYKGILRAHVVDSFFVDIGIPSDYEYACKSEI